MDKQETTTALTNTDAEHWMERTASAVGSMLARNNPLCQVCHAYTKKQVEYEQSSSSNYLPPMARVMQKTLGASYPAETQLARSFLFDEESVGADDRFDEQQDAEEAQAVIHSQRTF